MEYIVSVVDDLGPSGEEILQPPGIIQVGADVGAAQREDAFAMRRQHPKVFSKRPGMTNLVTHKVIIKGPQIVRLPS